MGPDLDTRKFGDRARMISFAQRPSVGTLVLRGTTPSAFKSIQASMVSFYAPEAPHSLVIKIRRIRDLKPIPK